VGFGHRRLAIIDLSQAAAQPMQRFGLTITYNGEIYNYLELRKELERQGMVFTTQSDTEVVLAAYSYWGKDCVQRFNGMWALAIYDEASKEVFLSRDRFGEKPLYYTQHDGRFLFASSLRALLPIAGNRSANSTAVMNYLLYEHAEPLQQSFFNGYFKLDAGHSLIINTRLANVIMPVRYYQLPRVQDSSYSLRKATEELRFLMHDAIAIRMRSDVEVGGTLSGGIDSSYVAAVAAEIARARKLPAFYSLTAGTSDPATNEVPYAQLMAAHCGLRLSITVAAEEDYLNALQSVVLVQEEPIQSLSVVMQYTVMQLAYQVGLKVLLDGQGADEVFLGYPVHLGIAMRQFSWPKAIALAMQSKSGYGLSAGVLAQLALYHAHPWRKAKMQRHRWSAVLARQQLQLATLEQIEAMNIAVQQSVQSFQAYEIIAGTLPALLRHEDRNAMAFSVETRLPYLDYRLVEWALQLPMEAKVNEGWSKYILRYTLQEKVPAAIAWRRGKIGFEPPALEENIIGKLLLPESLIQRGLKLLPNAPIHKLSTAMRWRLLSLQLWAEAFDVTFE
jgi:asparagine synthase (glutamine-hydrolysing)